MNQEVTKNVLHDENAVFSLSRGGLLSLRLKRGEESITYDRVAVLRAFPLTAPNEFLSVRLPSDMQNEIGMIERLSDLSGESRALVEEELRRRYMIPKIKKILALRRRGGLLRLTVESDLGKRSLTMRDEATSVRILEGGRVLLSEINGCLYEIEDPKKLDKASYRRIEVFL